MSITPHLTGYPRIGPKRELKWALERHWAGQLDRPEFEARVRDLRQAHLAEQRNLVGDAADDFFLYDQLLETALMLGMTPEWAGAGLAEDPFGVLSAAARGTEEHGAWELTKWFDTNYHCVIPEVARPVDTLTPLPWRIPNGDAASTAWVILGPYSVVKLSHLGPGVDPESLAASIGHALVAWFEAQRARQPEFRIQLDEPCLGLVMDDRDVAIRNAAYDAWRPAQAQPAPLVTVQFGHASPETLQDLGRRGFSVQIGLDHVEALRGTDAWTAQPELAIAVLDGRSVWPDDFYAARPILELLREEEREVQLIPSTSLIFLPYTVADEDLPAGFQFAREKAGALRQWAQAAAAGSAIPQQTPPMATWPEVREQPARTERAARREAQADLNLPPFPTTTIGSLPQTAEIRHLRLQLTRREITREAYDRAMAERIAAAIAWQETVGLDVLVHGEFERSDMVEYFAEQMDGFLTTRNGWVLSYGSRCTRPPILDAPPTIREPMTVDEWRVAQNTTSKPVKGMLTGPVTIVNWSFRPPAVPDDRLFWAVAQPIAQEVEHLIDAGARVIQIDEPAVRERWPLPTERAEELRAIYARGVRAALAHVFNQPAHVQMHTHMCYGTDASIAPLWSDVGVDVASIWYARSPADDRIQGFYAAFPDGHLQIGPGVFDVHSPFAPGTDAMVDRLQHVGTYMDSADVWVNPDCGLKTRSWDEVERQLTEMVAAARTQRVAVGH